MPKYMENSDYMYECTWTGVPYKVIVYVLVSVFTTTNI